MNNFIFSNLQQYAANWSKVSSRNFTPQEIEAVKSAVVVPSQYGTSVCFFMKNGSQSYIPVGRDSSLQEGDVVDLGKAQLIELSKPGEQNIYRVE